MTYTRILVVCVLILVLFFLFIKRTSGYTLLDWFNRLVSNANDSVYYPTRMEWCQELRENHENIYEEYLNYIQNHKLKRLRDIDTLQVHYDTSDIPWDVLILRIYNKDTDKINYFPKTCSLVAKVPGCTTAMFSVLHPGKVIPPHKGVYKGVLRYQLALVTPKNTKQCRIYVNDIPYHWEKGKDVIFDDTFLHDVKNESNETRVVLFLDIKKEFNNLFLNSLNSLVLYFIKFNDSVISIVDNTNKP